MLSKMWWIVENIVRSSQL